MPPQDACDDAIFYSLRDSVAAAFERSAVRRRQEADREVWTWSVCALPLRRGRDLLLGLNWGYGREHQPQLEPPGDTAITGILKERFGREGERLLRRFGRTLAQMNYFNVCPLRSPKISQLTEDDWNLAIHNFFVPALDAIAPPRTLILGIAAVKRLSSVIADFAWHATEADGRAAGWGSGVLVGASARHHFIVLPHPQARLKQDVRDRLWAEAFAE